MRQLWADNFQEKFLMKSEKPLARLRSTDAIIDPSYRALY